MIHCEILFWSVNSGGASNDAFTAIEDAVTSLNEFPCFPQPWAARVAALQSATGYKEIDNADLIQAPRRTKDDLYEVNILNEPDTTVFVLGSEHKIVQAETNVRTILDSCLKLKTRASLQLEGRQYANDSSKVMVLRLTKYPSNQYQGIVVGVVHQTAVEDDCSGEAYIDPLVTLFQEISEARAPGSKFVKIPHVAHEYQLQGSVEEEKQYLAVHLLQLFNVH